MADDPQPVQPQNVRVVEAPTYYFSGTHAFIASNDVIITLTRPQPVVIDNTPPGKSAAQILPVTILQCSISTAKDLMLILQSQVDQYEKDFGKLETTYTRALAAEKK